MCDKRLSPPASKNGFTLIELSIVLIIISMLVGGIFLGSTLMASAHLKSVIVDVNAFKQAIIAFRDKYHELPGDMPTATNQWGGDTGCPSTAYNVIPKKATCNGNGNGVIGGVTGTPTAPAAAEAYEMYRAWQHLANAGFINGAYAGVSSSATDVAGNISVPKSRIKGAYYSVSYVKPVTSYNGNYFVGNYGHVIQLGSIQNYQSTASYTILKAEDASDIDSKMDDGLPNTGNVMALGPSQHSSCTTVSNAGATASYNITTQGQICSLIFVTGF